MRRITLIKSLVAILLLSLMGQAFASASMQCQFGDMVPSEHKQEHQQMMFSGGMDHSQHVQDLMNNDSAASQHCLHCDCATGNCVSAVLPTSHIQFTQAPGASYLNYSGLTSNPLVFSLYRPPIIC